jgi:diaminobutyrate-2-oxoglutarate transaminase
MLSASPGTLEFESHESAVRYYCRHMPAVFCRAVNANVWDENGVEYIDFLSGCGSLNYGHNNPHMKERIISYLAGDGLVNGLDLHTVAKREFLQAFRQTILEPRKMNYRVQFVGPTGTNAVEAALKLARKVTHRRPIAAFTNAFHGMTLGSLSVSANGSARQAAGIQLDEVVRLPFEGFAGATTDDLDCYERMINNPSGGIDPPAAFIVETIQGEGGLNCASREWLRHLSGMARRLGSLLIIDDVQAGCGRTGDFFSFEAADISPDLICLAKSIGGIGLPMALLLIKPDYDGWIPGEHNGTFRGNNLAFVAATTAVEFWRDTDFLGTVNLAAARIGSWVRDVVQEFGSRRLHPKGRGLMSGISFADTSIAACVAREAFRHRLLIETCGPFAEVIKIMPPLTIETEVLEKGLSRLRSSIETSCSRGKLISAA